MELICDTIVIRIYICGDLPTIRNVLRSYCMKGACVTVQSAEYIYTGGAEYGVVIGLNNYPRFPKTEKELMFVGEEIGFLLMEKCCQTSFMVQGKNETFWYSRRKEIEVVNNTNE